MTGRWNNEQRAQLEQKVISAITVADLKDRLMSRLEGGSPEFIPPEISEQEAAQVGVDVVY